MNPTILKGDILAFAQEFNFINTGAAPTQLDTSLSIYNSVADNVVASPPYPSIANNPNSGASEVQNLAISAVPTVGTFVLALGGVVSAAINWNDSNAQILAKIIAMSNIGAGNVAMAGDFSTTGGITVTFQGALKQTGQPFFTVLSNTLQAASTPVTFTITELVRGFAPVTPIYLAKMLVICHWLKLRINTEGPVSMDKVGDLQSMYAVPDLNQNQNWNETTYGRQYLQLRRVYAPGISFSPKPRPAGVPPYC